MSLFSFAVTFHWKIISAHVKYKQIAVKYIQKPARKQSSSTKNPQKLPGSPGFHQKKSKSPGFPKEKNINFIQFPSFPQTFAHFHPFPLSSGTSVPGEAISQQRSQQRMLNSKLEVLLPADVTWRPLLIPWIYGHWKNQQFPHTRPGKR